MMPSFTSSLLFLKTAGRPGLWLLALLLLAAPRARAQAPAWQTAVGLNGTSVVYGTATDGAGNVYLTGGFSGTLVLGNTTLTSAGLRDVFVAKWAASIGSFVWAQRAGGAGDDYANGIAASAGSVYLVGVYGAAAMFGTTALNNPAAGTTGTNYDGYVAKLTDAGLSAAFNWAVGYGGSDREFGNTIGVSGSSIYIAGLFYSPSIAVGPFTLPNSAPTASPVTSDVYVAKLVDAGNTASFSWVDHTAGTGSEYCSSLAVSGSSVYLTGSFTSAAMGLGALQLTNANAGLEDTFVAKLTDQGTAPGYVWAQRTGGLGTEQALRIAATPDGVYIMGRFAGTATTTFGSTVLTNAGPNFSDVYVAKLVETGTNASFVWAQRLGGPGPDSAYGLAVRGSSVYVAGSFPGTATFGATTLTSLGANDVFVTRLLDAGTTAQVVWAQQAGGTGADDAYAALIIGPRLYVSGNIVPPASFGSLSVATPASSTVGFLASFTDAAGLATAPAAGPLAGSRLWPNPAHATATVQLPAVPGASAATLTLRDALGRAVRTATVPLPAAGQRHALDLTGLPAGLYALQVQAGEARATHRLVVE